MTKQLLPIGSVVSLKGANKRLMVCGIMHIKQDDNRQYDYMGCLYPEGIMDIKNMYLFNTGDITKVEFVGFADSERQVFVEKLAQLLANENNAG